MGEGFKPLQNRSLHCKNPIVNRRNPLRKKSRCLQKRESTHLWSSHNPKDPNPKFKRPQKIQKKRSPKHLLPTKPTPKSQKKQRKKKPSNPKIPNDYVFTLKRFMVNIFFTVLLIQEEVDPCFHSNKLVRIKSPSCLQYNTHRKLCIFFFYNLP